MVDSSKKIAISGAGAAGLTTALTLAKRGHEIMVFDPAGFPAPNASAMAGGMLAPYAEIEHMPMGLVQAGLESISLWDELCPNLIQKYGSLLVAHPQDRYILERFRSHLPQTHQTLHETEPLEPQLSSYFACGIHLEEEAHLDPHEAIHRLIKELQRLDVSFVSETLDCHSGFDWVIDCTGINAKTAYNQLRGVKGETAKVRNPELSLSRPVRLMHPRYPLYVIPRADQVYMIGATIIESEDEQVSARSAMELMSALYALHPSFGDAELLEFKAGIRPSFPDNLPRIDQTDNIISLNGMFRHGWLLAPIMAQCTSDIIDERESKHLTSFTRGYHENKTQRQAPDAQCAA